MTNKFSLIALTAGVGVAALAGPAAAQTVGSASYATHRSCATTAATAQCGGQFPGQQILTGQYGGGIGVGGLNFLSVGGGNVAWSDVRFDAALDLPEIRAFTRANDNLRMNINTIAFQSYTWTGDVSTAFSISGGLHIVDSSASASGGQLPGGAIYSQFVGIWDPSIIAGFTTAEQLFQNLFYRGCGTAGVLGAATGGGDLTGGEATYNVTTAECAAGSLTLTPGQQVLVVAGLQLPVNRGAFADSSATFTTRLGDDLSATQRADLVAGLESAISQGSLVSVPEPSAWAMMLAGFGLLGAALRRRGGSPLTA